MIILKRREDSVCVVLSPLKVKKMFSYFICGKFPRKSKPLQNESETVFSLHIYIFLIFQLDFLLFSAKFHLCGSYACDACAWHFSTNVFLRTVCKDFLSLLSVAAAAAAVATNEKLAWGCAPGGGRRGLPLPAGASTPTAQNLRVSNRHRRRRHCRRPEAQFVLLPKSVSGLHRHTYKIFICFSLLLILLLSSLWLWQ